MSGRVYAAMAPLLLLGVAMPVAAQERVPGSDPVVSAAGDGAQTGGRGVASGRSAVRVSAAQGDSHVTLTVSLDNSYAEAGQSANGGAGYVTNKLDLELSASLNEDGDFSSIFDSDGLGRGTTATLSYTSYRTTTNISRESLNATRPIWNRAGRQCVVENLPSGLTDVQRVRFLAQLDLHMASSPLTLFGTALDQLAEANGGADGDAPQFRTAANALQESCAPTSNDGEFVHRYAPTELQRYNSILVGGAPLTYWGLSASVGYAGYDFVDPVPFAEKSVDRVHFGVSGHVGWVDQSGNRSARGTVTYARTWESGDEQQICRPQATGPLFDCLNGPLAGPDRLDAFSIMAEGRQRITIGPIEVGVAPSVTYRFDKDSALLSLPIYFVPNADGDLIGGIRMGYDTGEDDFEIGLFVGIAFGDLF